MNIPPEESQTRITSSREPSPEVIWRGRVIRVVTVMAVAGGVAGYYATSNFRGAIMGIVAGATLGLAVGIYIEHRRNLGERQVSVAAKAPTEGDGHQARSPSHKQSEKTRGEVVDEAPTEGDKDGYQVKPPSNEQSEKTENETEFITQIKNDNGNNVVFSFKNKGVCTEFKKAFTALDSKNQKELALAISAQTQQGSFSFPLAGQKVSVTFAKVDAQKHVCTIERFDILKERAPRGDPKLAELLARMGRGMQAQELIGHLRPAVHRLNWPNGNRLGLIFGGRNIPQDVRNCLPQNQAHCAYFDEALAFLAAVENQGISIDVPSPPAALPSLILRDGTRVSVATNSRAWAITLGPGQQPIRIAQELIRLYKILDMLEAFGNDQGNNCDISSWQCNAITRK
ncbi:MAG: glycine zipper family protein [Puniceicoccales bacterium]|jgi:hypothetical protein|nr:glycine zipper family protein [Puniceicoccales bacterium]